MTNLSTARETAERRYFLVEERRFFDRTRADRAVSAIVAECLGLDAQAAQHFADRTVEAGIRSRDGRGGFDFLATQIVTCGHDIEELRRCYASMTAGQSSWSQAA